MNEWTNDQFPRDGSSGRGTYRAYSVEVRHNYPEPKTIHGKTYDREWRTVPIYDAPPGVGIPKPKYRHEHQDRLGLLGWSEANALRWIMHCASDEFGMGSLCLETRIVAHEIKYEYSEKVVAAYDPMGGDDFGGCRPPQKPYWSQPDDEAAGKRDSDA